MSHSIVSSNSSFDEGSHNGKMDRRAPKGMKCLPCFTHTSTGACIYGDHCRFLHDRNLSSSYLPNTTLEQRNNVDHKIRDDPIYWPPAFNPYATEEYTLDPKIVFHDDLRYKSIYSMWTFFVGAVSNNSEDWQNYEENPLTKRKRLPVFLTMAEGMSPANSSVPIPSSYVSVAKASYQARGKLTSFRGNKQPHFGNAAIVNIASRHVARMGA